MAEDKLQEALDRIDRGAERPGTLKESQRAQERLFGRDKSVVRPQSRGTRDSRRSDRT